jgi:hypothetical protein
MGIWASSAKKSLAGLSSSKFVLKFVSRPRSSFLVSRQLFFCRPKSLPRKCRPKSFSSTFVFFCSLNVKSFCVEQNCPRRNCRQYLVFDGRELRNCQRSSFVLSRQAKNPASAFTFCRPKVFSSETSCPRSVPNCP